MTHDAELHPFLFIGGPLNGYTIEVKHWRDTFMVETRYLDNDDGEQVAAPTCCNYIKTHLETRTSDHDVFVLEGVDPVKLMIDHYAKMHAK